MEPFKLVNPVQELLVPVRFPDEVQAGLIQRDRIGGGQDADVVDVGFLGIAVAVTVNGNPVHDVDEDHLISQVVADALGGLRHGLQELEMQLVMPVRVAGAAGVDAHAFLIAPP